MTSLSQACQVKLNQFMPSEWCASLVPQGVQVFHDVYGAMSALWQDKCPSQVAPPSMDAFCQNSPSFLEKVAERISRLVLDDAARQGEMSNCFISSGILLGERYSPDKLEMWHKRFMNCKEAELGKQRESIGMIRRELLDLQSGAEFAARAEKNGQAQTVVDTKNLMKQKIQNLARTVSEELTKWDRAIRTKQSTDNLYSDLSIDSKDVDLPCDGSGKGSRRGK